MKKMIISKIRLKKITRSNQRPQELLILKKGLMLIKLFRKSLTNK
jgi:hypothetical protein